MIIIYDKEKTIETYNVEKKIVNEIIEKFFRGNFRNINDVTVENLREFLVSIFENYQKGNIDYNIFRNIHDALDLHVIVISDGESLDFENSDYRSIGIEAIEYMNLMNNDFFMFPEDVPYFIKFLKTPRGEELEAHRKLKEYVSQFDFTKRLQEAHKRGYTRCNIEGHPNPVK